MDSINEILMHLAHDNINRYDTIDSVLLEKIYEKMEDMLYDYLMNYPKEFNEKLNKFYMSGTNNPAKIGYFNFALDNLDICDFYIVNDPQCKIPATTYNRFIELGKINEDYYQFKNYKENLDYKYLIYTDGNTLSDRMRLYLNSKSITFMHKPEYEEFYSPLLSNMNNYILFNDYSKLRDLKLMVEKDEKLVNNILNNNKIFNELFLNPHSIYKYISYTLENYAKIFH